MALPATMGNGGDGPVAEWRRREDGATSFILVQIQAGSPAFAREASERKKFTVDGRFLGLHGL
jgi:hypothetical protein